MEKIITKVIKSEIEIRVSPNTTPSFKFNQTSWISTTLAPQIRARNGIAQQARINARKTLNKLPLDVLS